MYQDSLNILDTRIGRIEQGSGTVRNATVKLYHFVSHDASNRTAPVIPFPITASSTDCFMHSGWNLKPYGPYVCLQLNLFPATKSLGKFQSWGSELVLGQELIHPVKGPFIGQTHRQKDLSIDAEVYTDGFGATNFGIFWDSINISNSSRLNIDKYGLISSKAQYSLAILLSNIWYICRSCWSDSHLVDVPGAISNVTPWCHHFLTRLVLSILWNHCWFHLQELTAKPSSWLCPSPNSFFGTMWQWWSSMKIIEFEGTFGYKSPLSNTFWGKYRCTVWSWNHPRPLPRYATSALAASCDKWKAVTYTTG